MLNKWSCALFVVFIIIFLLMVPGVHAHRQHDSSEEEENGRLSVELEEGLNILDEDDYILSQETTSPVSYDRQDAYDYAEYYWNRVCSDGYFWDEREWTSTNPTELTPGSLLGWRETSGYDCAHFVSCAIGNEPNHRGGGLDINYYRADDRNFPSYGEASAHQLRKLLLEKGLAEEVGCHTELDMGDLIFYDWNMNGFMNHVSLFIGNGKIAAHSYSYWNEPWDIYTQRHGSFNESFIRIKTANEPDCTVTLQNPPNYATISFPYTFEWSVDGNCTNFELAFLNIDEGGGGYINVSGTSQYISASDWDSYVSQIGNSSEYAWAIRKDGTTISNIHYFSVEDDPDCSVNTPDRPSGPTSGETGVLYEFETGGSSCSAGHGVQYQFSMRKDGGAWHDGEWRNTGWMVGEFFEEGTYDIRARARCASNTSIISSWSPSLTVVIGDEPDCSVNTPDKPSGPTSGEPYVNYTYSTGGSSCAAGHSVEYLFWWRKVGESWTSTSWGSSASTTFSFPEEGTYEIGAQARCAHSGVTSGYSEALTVVIEADPQPTPTWTRLASRAEAISYSNGVLAATFGHGTYLYQDGSWSERLGSKAESISYHDGVLAATFGHGTYLYEDGSWSERLGSQAESISYHDGVLAATFTHGTYLYEDGSWSERLGSQAESISYHDGVLAATFGHGTYLYENGSWSPRLGSKAELISYSDGVLAATFGHGTYLYQGGSWSGCLSSEADSISYHGGVLAATFGHGTYLYQNGSWGERLSSQAESISYYNGVLAATFGHGTYFYE